MERRTKVLLIETLRQMAAGRRILESDNIQTKNLKTRISLPISQVKICACLMISSHRQQSQLPFTQVWHFIQTIVICKAQILIRWVNHTVSVDLMTLPLLLKNGLRAFILSLGCHHLRQVKNTIRIRQRINTIIVISLNKPHTKWSQSRLHKKFEPLRSKRKRWRLHHQLKLQFRWLRHNQLEPLQ